MVKRILRFFTEISEEIQSGHLDIVARNTLFYLGTLFIRLIFEAWNTEVRIELRQIRFFNMIEGCSDG